MAYRGITSPPITLGNVGIVRDDSMDKIPYNAVLDARNITMQNGMIEKELGSLRFNPSAVPGGIRAAYQWEPIPYRKKTVMVGGDGKIYSYQEGESQIEITPLLGSPEVLTLEGQPHFLEGGQEVANKPKKLFIFTGGSQVQVIEGDDNQRRNISGPSSDWATTFPTFGFIMYGRIVAFGNNNFPHAYYVSDDDDQENFSTVIPTTVFPGEGRGLLGAFAFKGTYFLGKYPRGLYKINAQGPDPANWLLEKSVEDFGMASPHSGSEVLQDCLIANSTNGLTTLSATLDFGDVRQGDVFNGLRNESFVRELMDGRGIEDRWCVYYENRKQFITTYKSKNSNVNDFLCILDFSNMNSPKVLWSNKDQANCLLMIRDSDQIERPYYGSQDGYIYSMSRLNRDVQGVSIDAWFRTPDLDFSFVDPAISEKNKIFQFLNITYEATGEWNVYVDVFIDAVYYATVSFQPSYGPVLGDLELDVDPLTGRTPRSKRIKIPGTGRRIGFRFRNTEYRENFKLISYKVDFKLGGDAQRGMKE